MGNLAMITRELEEVSDGTRASVPTPLAPLAREEARPGRGPWEGHFRPGTLLELSGKAPGKLSTVARLVAHLQGEGEPVAWVSARQEAGFYPPDFASVGVDLSALVVVRVPLERGAHALVRASEVLLRSGAFGLVVLDFAATPVPRGELAWQARLSGLVRMHDARLVVLTSSGREEPSLGPLITLRVEPEARLQGMRVLLTPHVLKSKLGTRATLSPDVRMPPLGARPAHVASPGRLASLQPASLQPASLQPASLQPASLQPASLQPASFHQEGERDERARRC